MNQIIFKENEDLFIDAQDPRAQHLKILFKEKKSRILKICHLKKGSFFAQGTFEAQGITFTSLQARSSLSPQVTLLLALSRPLGMRRILEMGTTIGIKKFIIYTATLSEKSYGTSQYLTPKSIEKTLLHGLAQSAYYGQLPEVTFCSYKSQLPNLSGAYILDPHSQKVLTKTQNPLFCVGPERGWTDEECQYFYSQGAQGIKVSQSILRVEHAVYQILAQNDYLNLS